MFVMASRCDTNFTNIQIKESEVTDILNVHKLNKATGPDGLNFGIAFNLDFKMLTSGSPDFDNETNKFIMLSVLRFIKDSHRFD